METEKLAGKLEIAAFIVPAIPTLTAGTKSTVMVPPVGYAEQAYVADICAAVCSASAGVNAEVVVPFAGVTLMAEPLLIALPSES